MSIPNIEELIFEEWEKLIFDNKQKFIKYFFEEDNVETIISVHWNSCTMKVFYMVSDVITKKFEIDFSLQLWYDYLEELNSNS